MLQALAVRPGTVVRPEAIAEALWGEDLPASWAKVVQGCIVRLRKALGQDTIYTSPQGYRLRAHVDHLDHLRFEHLLGRARELLAEDEPERASFLLSEALGLWRGDPFADLGEWGAGRVEAERLIELRRDAEDVQTEASLRRGRYEEALGSAYRLVQTAGASSRSTGRPETVSSRRPSAATGPVSPSAPGTGGSWAFAALAPRPGSGSARTCPVVALAVSADGQRAVAAAGKKPRCWTLGPVGCSAGAALGFVAVAFTWAPDGRTIAASGGGTALLDAGTPAAVWQVAGPQAGGEDPTFSPRGERFLTTGEGRVSVFDGRSGAVVGSLRFEDLSAAAFAKDTWELTFVSSKGAISTWDARPEAAFAAACRIAGRDLTEKEWRTYLPDRKKVFICPG